MSRWQVSVTFRAAKAFTEDDAFDMIDVLTDHGASMSVKRDLTGGTVTLTVEGTTPLNAASDASSLVVAAAAPIIGDADVTGLEVLTEEAVDAELARALFPAVVGYAEIAKMAGVSRQRARQFASLTGFPAPVIETAHGPLMGKHAVERWLKIRNTTNGRPPKALANA